MFKGLKYLMTGFPDSSPLVSRWIKPHNSIPSQLPDSQVVGDLFPGQAGGNRIADFIQQAATQRYVQSILDHVCLDAGDEFCRACYRESFRSPGCDYQIYPIGGVAKI